MSESATATASEAKTFSIDDAIPPAFWGKDHWSTLAYVDTVMVDCGAFEIGADGRMRSSRRNYRVMCEENPRPLRSGGHAPAVPMDSTRHSTRLNNGQMVVGHDDWACVRDMASVNLFTHPVEAFEPGVTLRFTRKGRAWAEALREFKRQGGNFGSFSADDLPELPEEAPSERETFTWMSARFDITKMLADIACGKLKPKLEVLDAFFVEDYSCKILGLDKSKPDEAQSGTLLMSVDVLATRNLPLEVLDTPAVLAHVGKNKGMLKMGVNAESSDYVLADGNHRVGRRYLDNLGATSAYLLSAAQSRRYRF